MLAAKVLMSQGIEIIGICFSSNFFDCGRARESAKIIGIDLIEEDLSEKILSIVKCPACGYGKNLNPCIDCHSLMIREAVKYLKPEIKKDLEMVNAEISGTIAKASKGKDLFDFIATGEVLGQRPFSQNKEALTRVAVMAGVEVLRPLSAKLLPETAIEKKGLVNRSKLLAVKGRSREEQMKLAKKFGIKNYPTPAGGCLLTDPEGAKKVLDIIVHCPDCKTEDVELLKHGRVFWLKIGSNKTGSEKIPLATLSLKSSLRSLIGAKIKNVKVKADINFHWVLAVVGRDREESERLERLAKKGGIVVRLNEITGPTTLARLEKFKLPAGEKTLKIAVPEKLDLKKMEIGKIKSENEILGTLGLLTGYYATKVRGKKVDVNFKIK